MSDTNPYLMDTLYLGPPPDFTDSDSGEEQLTILLPSDGEVDFDPSGLDEVDAPNLPPENLVGKLDLWMGRIGNHPAQQNREYSIPVRIPQYQTETNIYQ